MFDKRAAFEPLNGKRMSFHDFMTQLGHVRLRWIAELPADIGRRELYEIAKGEGWLVEETGFVTVTM